MKIKLLPILTGLALFAFGQNANAQNVPNGDFEQQITGGVLPGWVALGGTITQRETLQVTSNGQQQEIKSNGGLRFLTLTNTQQIAGIRTAKHAINTTPTGIRFQTMYFPQSTDGFVVSLLFTKAAQLDSNSNVITDSSGNAIIDTVLNASIRITGARFPWQTFTLSIPDSLYQGVTPDSVAVTFLAGTFSGSTLAIDDVLFVNYATSTGPVSLLSGDLVLYPNPSSDNINLTYTTNMETTVNISMYDIQGKLVKNIISENQNNGEHTQNVNVSDLTTGIYFFRVTVGDKTEVIKFNKQ